MHQSGLDRSGRSAAVAVLLDGPSSSGKSTLCRALQLRLTELAQGDPERAFARVAFDDVGLLIAESLYPTAFLRAQAVNGNDVGVPAAEDDWAAFDYVDDSAEEGMHGGSPRVRLVLKPHARRLLHGVHLSWAAHLSLGSNLVIDHFLQEEQWVHEALAAVRGSGASLFSVGVSCSLAELERRESSRADGGVEGRPLGLARRSDELCRANGLVYDITVDTGEQPTAESVDTIVAALQAASYIV